MATTIDLTTLPSSADGAPETRPPITPPSRLAWLGFLVVLAAAVMDLLDSTIAQTAAPVIRTDLGGSYADIEWISAAYTLAMSVTLLLGGRLGDILGRRRVLLASMGGFVGASVLCAMAPTPETLIGARVLQGAVGALMIPQGFGLIRELFGDEGQQKAFAIFGPVMGLSAVAGPLLGGGLVDLDLLGSGWRAIFLVNVPVGIAAIVLGRRVLPRTPPVAPHARIDPLSVLLAMAGGGALVYPLIEGRELGWPAWSIALLVGGLATLVAFGLRQSGLQRAGATPLVEPSVLQRRAYVGGLVLVVCFMGAMGGMILALNVMFQTGLGFSPLSCGVATVAIPLAAIAGTITSAMLVGRLGRMTLQLGTGTMALGLVWVDYTLRSHGGGLSAWDLVAPLTLTGFGMGQIFMPMFDIILAGVAPRQLGSASGLLEAIQQLAMSLGIAVVGTVLFDAVGAAQAPGAFVGAAGDALRVCVGFLVAAFVVTWWLPRHARESH